MADDDSASTCAKWARFRFAVVGGLLADPPERGELQKRIRALAASTWKHPITGKELKLSFATIERGFYAAKAEQTGGFDKLKRKTRKDAGVHRLVSEPIAQAIGEQYRDHPSWQYKLHYDNLVALCKSRPELGQLASLPTVVRYMKDHGLVKQKKRKTKRQGLELRERRSFEVRAVNQLWHLDFHEGSRRVVLADGSYAKPWLLGIIDDHSRLACHLQWYLVENAENLIHGLTQALQKRDVPRALMTDGGGAMKADETQQGLARLCITHEMTLPQTPEQNGKQENFWTRIESRLLPMLEGEPRLTLRLLNEATQAWVEMDYNRKVHSETGQTPLDRFLHASDNMSRPCPDPQTLHRAFCTYTTRAQRKSDGTISVEGKRFEIPSRYRTLQRVRIRYQRWDLSEVEMLDARSETLLCSLRPVDRQKNSDEPRRIKEPIADPAAQLLETPAVCGPAPLLQQYIASYSATGLLPAYIPKDELTKLTEQPS